jgi:TPR repeat protein
MQQSGQNSEHYIRKFEDAAAEDHVLAMNKLGSIFYQEKKDYNSAVEWFRKASDKGCPRALNNLGMCYELGHGVANVDTDQAFRMYKESAEKGYLEGMFNLGQLCYRTARHTRSQD